MKKTLRISFNPIGRLIERFAGKSPSGPYSEVGEREIFIIARGEQVMYRDRRGAVVVEISIPEKWISAEAINLWDGVRSVSEAEKGEIFLALQEYFKKYQNIDMKRI